MESSSVALVVLPLAAALIVMLLIYPRSPKPRATPRPRWQYLMLWPLLRDRSPPLVGRSIPHSGAHETVGWLIVAALMIVAITFAV